MSATTAPIDRRGNSGEPHCYVRTTPRRSGHLALGAHHADTTCRMSISLTGFVAGPDESLETRWGSGAQRCRVGTLDPRAAEADKIAIDWLMRTRGAYVLGRNCSAPPAETGTRKGTGRWGPEAPYHAALFGAGTSSAGCGRRPRTSCRLVSCRMIFIAPPGLAATFR